MTTVNSAFYTGHVFHKRLVPKLHQFNYPMYMTFLDLDELDFLAKKNWWFSCHRWAPLQFNHLDYFKYYQYQSTDQKEVNNHNTKQLAINIAKNLGANTNKIDRVCMLAQLRCFGLYFSPVNFFFLYENDSAKYLVAEVSNTPWNKKHCYLIDLKKPEPNSKEFHVSPFMDLNMEYRWQVNPPQEDVRVRIENWNEQHLFTAVFSGKRHRMDSKNAMKVLFQWPLITATIIRRIYWQATKLFLKGIRYIPYQLKTTHKKN
jgi:DUF1365 family protein